MRALVLDGAHADDQTGDRVRRIVEAELAAGGWDVESFTLRDQRIGSCAGDFHCWVKHPGVCMTDDDNRVIAAAVVRSDLVVQLSPVIFGGPSAPLKRALDHLIQNLSPGFLRVDGETHHQRRYARYPDLLVAGWLDRPDPDDEALFRALAGRNAINLHAGASAAGTVPAVMTDEEIRDAVTGWLRAIAERRRIGHVALPATPATASGQTPRRALLLVGSPRKGSSTSNALGSYLADRMADAGMQVDTVQLHPLARSAARIDVLADAMDEVDLVVLAFPLYVDSLPAPVTGVLERVAERRASRRSGSTPMLVAVANCGFPEAAHNDAALAVCATFARDAGFTWAGGLSLGGGEGAVHGQPLESLGGRVRHTREALDLAARALAQGDPIPERARVLMATPFIPPWLYRAMGGFGWRLRAREHGAAMSLGRRPYETAAVPQA